MANLIGHARIIFSAQHIYDFKLQFYMLSCILQLCFEKKFFDLL